MHPKNYWEFFDASHDIFRAVKTKIAQFYHPHGRHFENRRFFERLHGAKVASPFNVIIRYQRMIISENLVGVLFFKLFKIFPDYNITHVVETNVKYD